MSKKLSEADQRDLFEKDEKIRKSTEGEWPKYAMSSWLPEKPKEDKNRKFLSFGAAAQLYDSGFLQREFGIYVLYPDFTMRRMTEVDQEKISDAADEYSANK